MAQETLLASGKDESFSCHIPNITTNLIKKIPSYRYYAILNTYFINKFLNYSINVFFESRNLKWSDFNKICLFELLFLAC